MIRRRLAAARARFARLGSKARFSDPLVRAATRYLEAFYAWDTNRRWTARPEPEWFDHRADIYRFSESRNPCWAERGVHARELMHERARVLDLCCGDGFYAFHFYSEVAEHVDACDRDSAAIAHAEVRYSHPRITYWRRDVVAGRFPGADYDVVVWDAAIDRFELAEIDVILEKVDAALKPDGVLCGYTIVNTGDRKHRYHRQEFASAADVAKLLRRKFPSVVTLETTYPDRQNIYFRAGRTPVSFGGFRDPG